MEANPRSPAPPRPNASAEPFPCVRQPQLTIWTTGEPHPRIPHPPLGGGGALPQRRRWSMEDRFPVFVHPGAGITVLVIIVANRHLPDRQGGPVPFRSNQAKLLHPTDTGSRTTRSRRFGIAAIAYGTVLTSVIALLLAVPIATAHSRCA